MVHTTYHRRKYKKQVYTKLSQKLVEKGEWKNFSPEDKLKVMESSLNLLMTDYQNFRIGYPEFNPALRGIMKRLNLKPSEKWNLYRKRVRGKSTAKDWGF